MAKTHRGTSAQRTCDELTVSHRERLIGEVRADPTLAADYLNAVAEAKRIAYVARAAGGAFRFGPWQTQASHEGNQQLRAGSLLPARTLQAGIRRREEARLGLLALKRLDQFRAVEVCVVEEQPALGESINI